VVVDLAAVPAPAVVVVLEFGAAAVHVVGFAVIEVAVEKHLNVSAVFVAPGAAEDNGSVVAPTSFPAHQYTSVASVAAAGAAAADHN